MEKLIENKNDRLLTPDQVSLFFNITQEPQTEIITKVQWNLFVYRLWLKNNCSFRAVYLILDELGGYDSPFPSRPTLTKDIKEGQELYKKITGLVSAIDDTIQTKMMLLELPETWFKLDLMKDMIANWKIKQEQIRKAKND